MTFTPRFTDLVTMLHDVVSRFADRPVLGVRRPDSGGGGGSWTSYAELGKLVEQCRAGLAQRGVGRGDRVAVISNNRLEWAVAAYACFSLGAIYVPMYESQLDGD